VVFKLVKSKKGSDDIAFRVSLLIVLVVVISIGLITIGVALNSNPTSSAVTQVPKYVPAKLGGEVGITILPVESSNQTRGNE